MAIPLVIDPYLSLSPFSSSRILQFHGRPSSSLPFNYTRSSYIKPLSASPKDSIPPTDVKTLIKSYKQALSQDNKISISETEKIIYEIEKEKKRLDQKILSLSVNIVSDKEKRIRLQADFDNTRKKVEKDKLSTESNAKVQIMKSLLPIIDSFERARQEIIKHDNEKEKKINTSYQGIYKQFVEVLRYLGVAPIATVGKPFDPLLHEAITREESEVTRAGIITEELNRGFLLGNRLLRQAKVKVSLGPIKKMTPSAVEETTPSD